MYLRETRLKFYVREEAIYQTYFPDFSLYEKCHSPLRKKDDDPSLSFAHLGHRIVWRDWGMPPPEYTDAIGFVMELFGLTRDEAVDKIWDELVMDEEVKLSDFKKMEKPVKFDYEYRHCELRDWEMPYWEENYKVKRPLLDFFDVYSLLELSRVQKEIWRSKRNNPAYIYLFGEEGVFKAYRPLDPDDDRWRGQNNGHIIEGWNQLPEKGEHLFIQSSLKDTIVCRNIGVLSCNPTSETSFRTLLEKKEEIEERFDNIFILFDNDKAGEEAAAKLHEETGWTPVFIEKEKIWSEKKQKYAKDPSDTVEYSGDYLYLKKFFSKFVKKYYYHEHKEDIRNL